MSKFGRILWAVVWLWTVGVPLVGVVLGVGWLGWWLEGLAF